MKASKTESSSKINKKKGFQESCVECQREVAVSATSNFVVYNFLTYDAVSIIFVPLILV